MEYPMGQRLTLPAARGQSAEAARVASVPATAPVRNHDQPLIVVRRLLFRGERPQVRVGLESHCASCWSPASEDRVNTSPTTDKIRKKPECAKPLMRR
jgi:hypothetical protein